MSEKQVVQNCIRQLRFESGQMTQVQLAEALGVSRQTIIAIESGKYTPSLPLAFKIARVFGRSLEGVFSLLE